MCLLSVLGSILVENKEIAFCKIDFVVARQFLGDTNAEQNIVEPHPYRAL